MSRSSSPSFQMAQASTTTHLRPSKPPLKPLSNITVPSFSAFRARNPAPPRSLGSARRTISVDATPTTPNKSSSLSPLPDIHSRPASIHSPTVRQGDWEVDNGFSLAPRDLDIHPHGLTPDTLPATTFSPTTDANQSESQILSRGRTSSVSSDESADLLRPRFDRSQTSWHTARDSISDGEATGDAVVSERSPDTNMSASPKPSELTLQAEGQTPGSASLEPSSPSTARPKSPGAKVSSFFGWKSKSDLPAESPTTQFSDSRSRSPSPPNTTYANGNGLGLNYPDGDESYASIPPSPLGQGQTGSFAYVDELLGELRELSAELAASIRREMDLEDEVDRYRTEMPTGPHEQSRRTSDYFSDSGASSMRLPVADPDTKMESLEKMRRKAEQEKAQIRTEMSQRVQDDLNQRRALEMHVQSLEEQLQIQQFQAGEPSQKEKELESQLDAMKRRIGEEKDVKQNFEDLLAAMREEAESFRNERDNLRDEVVPQLRAQLEGLESESSELQNLTYENTRMQQELESMKNENQTLQNARKLQLDMHSSGSTVGRSTSTRHRSGSQARHGGSKDHIPIEFLPDRLKDVEDQRDALHRTLKALITRQDLMTKHHAKTVRDLEAERDRALSSTPRRAAFNLEVMSLRQEVNHLRKRADDAMESKWQCEKGLSGLKMDLDRTRQETSSLRELLQAHDILVPDNLQSENGEDGTAALDKAYTELQSSHKDAIDRMQQSGDGGASAQAADLRMSTLSHQVERQITSNNELRQKLAKAVGRGEKEQEASTKTVMDLESKLRYAEESLITAQSISEEAITKQEEHVKEMSDTVTEQSKRGLASPVKPFSPNRKGMDIFSPGSSKSVSPFSSRGPRLHITTTGKAVSLSEAGKTQILEERVRELETAARNADSEMHIVLEKMNRAQMEVADLQAERDEAMKQTRKLQREIVAERELFKAMA